MVATNDRIVLLFCHGSSYTKETWTPIIQRLQASPLLQQGPNYEVVSFDWRFHGENYDHSDVGEVSLRDGLTHSKRVEHPAKYWPQWSQDMLSEQVAKIRQGHDTAVGLIAIGHSMGASALLQYELDHPGTFEAFIGFEPIYDSGVLSEDKTDGARDLLVSVSLAREAQWPSKELAVAHLKSSRAFRGWHPEALDAYLESALVIDAETGACKLAMTPTQEAAGFCHEFLQFTPETLAHAQCPLFFEHAERSFFFFPQSALALAEKLGGNLRVGAAIPKTTHVMVHENPDACAQRILENLATLPLFQ